MPIPLPVIADTYRCALEWRESTSAQTAVNVIHVRAGVSGSTASDAFGALDTEVTAAMWGFQLGSAAVDAVNITPLDGTSATTSFPTGRPSRWTGTAGGAFTPQ